MNTLSTWLGRIVIAWAAAFSWEFAATQTLALMQKRLEECARPYAHIP